MDRQPIKVLVAEDDETNRTLLALLLEQDECEVHLAADGYEAIRHMLTGMFDIVVTDWDMPGLNGTDFLALSRVYWADTPVLIVSAHEIPFAGGIPRGAYAWIKKPFTSHELLQVLHEAVRSSASRRRVPSTGMLLQP